MTIITPEDEELGLKKETFFKFKNKESGTDVGIT